MRNTNLLPIRKRKAQDYGSLSFKCSYESKPKKSKKSNKVDIKF